MRKNPCYKCLTRTATCHGSCKDYLDWRVECDMVREAVKKKKINDRHLTEMEIKRATRITKGEWKP